MSKLMSNIPIHQNSDNQYVANKYAYISYERFQYI